jgi:hypothetical protein
VDVKTAGTYNISAHVGVALATASFRLDAFQGADSASSGKVGLTLALSACTVECYHYWNYLPNIGKITLKAGVQLMRIQITDVGYNFDYLDLALATGTAIRLGNNFSKGIAPQASPHLDAQGRVFTKSSGSGPSFIGKNIPISQQ